MPVMYSPRVVLTSIKVIAVVCDMNREHRVICDQ